MLDNHDDYKVLCKEVKAMVSKLTTKKQTVTLADRLDIAYEIHIRCAALIAYQRMQNKNPERAVLKYNLAALDFMQKILDASSHQQALIMMDERIKRRQRNNEYIPGKHNIETPTKIGKPEEASSNVKAKWQEFATKALMASRRQALAVHEEDRERDEQVGMIKLKPEERDQHRAIIQNGVVLRRDKNNNLIPYSTMKMSSHRKPSLAAFTVNMNGEISIFTHNNTEDNIAHSTMNSGKVVLYAGEIMIDKGRIIAITDHSGHYQPDTLNLYELLKFFVKQGVDLRDIMIDTFSLVKGVSPIADTHNRLQYKTNRLYDATDIYQRMQSRDTDIDKAVTDGRRKELLAMKTKMLLGGIIDRLQDVYPLRPENILAQESGIIREKIILSNYQYLLEPDFKIGQYILYYQDDQDNLRYIPVNAKSDFKAVGELIRKVDNASTRLYDLDAHYFQQFDGLLSAMGIKITQADFYINRDDAERELKANPNKIIIRASAKGGNHFVISSCKNGVISHQLHALKVDPQFHDVSLTAASEKILKVVAMQNKRQAASLMFSRSKQKSQDPQEKQQPKTPRGNTSMD